MLRCSSAWGFAPRLRLLWRDSNDSQRSSQQQASDITGGLGAIARVLRLVLQSAVLATGAYLVIAQEAGAGIIIAASILTARALAPVDIAIANWRSLIAARQSCRRLARLLTLLPDEPRPMALPAPAATLQLENVIVRSPESRK